MIVRLASQSLFVEGGAENNERQFARCHADGDVDGRDFLVWQRGGSPNPLSAGDLALWQAQYGTPLTAASSAVPEPAGGCLALGLLAGIFFDAGSG